MLEAGDVHGLQLLIDLGVDINTMITTSINPPPSVMASFPMPELLYMLCLHHLPSPVVCGQFLPLFLEHKDFIVNNGNINGFTPLMYAADEGDLALFETLAG